jgi:hypothetical protein
MSLPSIAMSASSQLGLDRSLTLKDQLLLADELLSSTLGDQTAGGRDDDNDADDEEPGGEDNASSERQPSPRPQHTPTPTSGPPFLNNTTLRSQSTRKLSSADHSPTTPPFDPAQPLPVPAHFPCSVLLPCAHWSSTLASQADAKARVLDRKHGSDARAGHSPARGADCMFGLQGPRVSRRKSAWTRKTSRASFAPWPKPIRRKPPSSRAFWARCRATCRTSREGREYSWATAAER